MMLWHQCAIIFFVFLVFRGKKAINQKNHHQVLSCDKEVNVLSVDKSSANYSKTCLEIHRFCSDTVDVSLLLMVNTRRFSNYELFRVVTNICLFETEGHKTTFLSPFCNC